MHHHENLTASSPAHRGGLAVALALCGLAASCGGGPNPTAPTTAAELGSVSEGGGRTVSCSEGVLTPIELAAPLAPSARGVMRQRAVTVDVVTLLKQSVARVPVSFNLFDDACVVAVPDEITELGSDTISWTGHVRDDPDASPVVVVISGSDVAASLRTTGSVLYEIASIGGGIHAARQINPSGFPPD